MQALFDPVISEITSLVSQQVKEAKAKKNANIDVLSNPLISKFIFREIMLISCFHQRIILVGGFAESPYLNNALEDWCWKNGDITLICPEYPQVIPLIFCYIIC
jgi:hypothetical protein